LGAVYSGMNRHRDSLVCFLEAVEALERLGVLPPPVLLGNIASAHFHLGERAEARRALMRALNAGLAMGHTGVLLHSLYLCVAHLDDASAAADAAALSAFILAHPSLHAHTRAAFQARDYPGVFERRLSPEAWAAAQASGAAYSLDSAVEYALGWLQAYSS
jgi:hypothetical protein